MTSLVQAWPYVAAFLVGALIPRRQSRFERFSLGLVALLSVAFISSLWPEKAVEAAAEAPSEWPHLLNFIVLLPIVGAVALLFMPRQSPKLLRGVTLTILAVDFIASLLLLRTPMTDGWHFQYVREWLPAFGIRYHVAVDGISIWMVVLSTFITPIAAYASFGSIKKRTKDLCFSLLLLHGAMLGAFVSLDLFLFYVFWELMLVPMVILIGIWGGVEKIKASYKFFLYTMAGSLLMLAAILYMVWTHDQLEGYPSFDYLALSRLVLPKTAAYLCFGAFAVAFLVKVPMFPLHTWLPDAHVQAPTGGSVILAAVLLKLGTYAYIRFCMGMFAGPAYWAAANLAGLAVGGGILYAALVAWKQPDIKKLIAYSSVAHLGFVMLGLFAGTQAGIAGGILQMINHGISTAALFILVGVIYDRRHTRLVSEFGGLAKVMPIYTACFVLVTMSSIGVPGTNGFVGEFMVIMGTFTSPVLGSHAKLQGGLAAFGVILAAVYMLSMVQRTFFGPLSNPKNQHLPDLNVRETVALAPLIAMIFVLGLFPNLFLERINPSVAGVQSRFMSSMAAFRSQHDQDPTRAVMLPRPSGKLGAGYPEDPKKPAESAATASAEEIQ
ncbi:MAG: NADH-quinone oxidoreductase subunit M [Polyangiaceae bacterium]|nr:NADH-quinone oxidoreductase subunit M [Polyangiaceae bacterium]MCW5791682.1 NADH-quinone oxidoreductase subunit M [Polyangiaceae bacterium]